jgi:hypothetical protein
MIQGRKSAIAVLAALAATGAVYGDMMPLPDHRPAAPSSNSYDCVAPEPVAPFDSSAHAPSASSDGLPFTSFATLEVTAEQTESPQPTLQVLGHGPGSLDLCLYALVGLGLCRSGHWAKKAALGFVPDWYHSGAPFQIGHSYALSPDTLCPVPVYCFIQPDGTPDNSLSPYRTGPIASPRPSSQHTPAALPSRGPPTRCC